MADEINHAPVDRFTLLHALTGLGMGAMGVSMPVIVGVAIGWEIVEHELKEAYPDAFPHPSQDTLENAAMDIVAMTAGGWVGRRG